MSERAWKSTARVWRGEIIIASSIVGIAFVAFAAFHAGVQWSRDEVRRLTDEMAGHPVNSFTRCLDELWEQSGELDPQWRGKRKWVLQEQKP